MSDIIRGWKIYKMSRSKIESLILLVIERGCVKSFRIGKVRWLNLNIATGEK